MRTLSWLCRLAERLSLASAYFAAALVFGLVILILTEVLMRNFLGKSTLMAEEVGGYAFVAVAFLGLAYTSRTGGHFRVRLLIDRLSSKTRYYLYFPTKLLSIAVVGVGVWRSGVTVWRSYQHDVISLGILHTPQYIPQLAMFAGMVLFALQLIAELFVGEKKWEEMERKSLH